MHDFYLLINFVQTFFVLRMFVGQNVSTPCAPDQNLPAVGTSAIFCLVLLHILPWPKPISSNITRGIPWYPCVCPTSVTCSAPRHRSAPHDPESAEHPLPAESSRASWGLRSSTCRVWHTCHHAEHTA